MTAMSRSSKICHIFLKKKKTISKCRQEKSILIELSNLGNNISTKRRSRGKHRRITGKNTIPRRQHPQHQRISKNTPDPPSYPAHYTEEFCWEPARPLSSPRQKRLGRLSSPSDIRQTTVGDALPPTAGREG